MKKYLKTKNGLQICNHKVKCVFYGSFTYNYSILLSSGLAKVMTVKKTIYRYKKKEA